MKIRNLGELSSVVSDLGAKMIDGVTGPRDTVVIFDKETKIISTIEDIRVEVHPETGARTVWIESEEM